jgi:hypothetical protein
MHSHMADLAGAARSTPNDRRQAGHQLSLARHCARQNGHFIAETLVG